ncbi:MAG: UDP-2,3-diacylglucosamine diphosphatase [Deltaproteobacteria bacterium]|nr:UDP-2,3-diacylglucosamine diphosphatase [Deltaproteobacteria bacterium]
MKAVFVADAHIKGQDDPTQQAFVELLTSFASGPARADVVVLLGDIFDFLTNFKGYDFPQYKPALDAIKKLSDAGIKVFYAEGNHDFLLSPYITARTGAEACPDTAAMDIDGKRVLFCHGDVFDESVGYIILRGFLRSPLLRAIKRVLGPSAGVSMADFFSKKSGKAAAESKKYIKLDESFKRIAYELIGEKDVLVAAHTHVAGVVTVEKGGMKCIYANPGSFASERTFIWCDKGAYELKKF